MSNFILISIIIAICLWFIVNMIDKNYIALYQNQKDKSETLWRIIKHIRKQLALTQLKECPIEELKEIPKELIEWIDYLEKGVEDAKR